MNTYKIYYNTNGRITGILSNLDNQTNYENNINFDNSIDITSNLTEEEIFFNYHLSNGELVHGLTTDYQAEKDTKRIQSLRKTEYPDIGEQLDMLWHAIDTGTLDKTSDFYTVLKSVKDTNPKPE